MKLHNTLTRKVEEFKPLDGRKVKLYACGLTVYSQPHIGNWVAYIYWDILVRTLRANDYEVEHVQNITDVGHLTSDEDAGEDKMLKGALKEGTTAWEVAEKYSKIADHEAYDLLGLTRPSHIPRATEYIEQQIKFVEDLEAKGYTYVIEDGVYFDTSKLKDYGKLAQLDIEGLQFGVRVKDTGKKSPTDFALWKFSPKDQQRDMEWDTKWGKGFPGWHLECSVMSRELLGDQLDIHTGGIDHIPVHHTNEIAQSEAVTGKQFSQFWVHANHIKVNGTKMSKSLDNIYTLDDIQKKGFELEAFKLLILDKHYSTEGNFTWETLESAQNSLNRLRAWADLRYQPSTEEMPKELDDLWGETLKGMRDALANDLDTHGALTKLYKLVTFMENHPIPHGNGKNLGQALAQIDNWLGLNLGNRPDISDEQKQLIANRESAREAKDWQKSDELRDELKEQGIEVRDTAKGTIWNWSNQS